MPLWMAVGAGSVARQILGTVVVTGMLAATMIGIFIVPVLFVVVEKLVHRKEQPHAPQEVARVVAEGVAD
jgi:HAE1 family hydrophobic/amphiphilic exporter-1